MKPLKALEEPGRIFEDRRASAGAVRDPQLDSVRGGGCVEEELVLKYGQAFGVTAAATRVDVSGPSQLPGAVAVRNQTSASPTPAKSMQFPSNSHPLLGRMTLDYRTDGALLCYFGGLASCHGWRWQGGRVC